ncbi:nuclear transport factor 2 family protein [uncultured Tenacibaculum sp.]|uniref:nuclear transport factor 2 family protein n=1 Tax=uncultured Tenacibaculum sp. TaxID=174713 RepID=UPI002620B316|nr:nuclear transport factor 2 family protein [uncultured Tenacibaculum sp.]
MDAVVTLNPELVIQDYTSDAIFITPDKTYKGKDEIFQFYQEFLPNFKDFDFITLKQEVHANVVYFVWHGKNEYISVQLATDTYIIENGKIKQHTFAGNIN